MDISVFVNQMLILFLLMGVGYFLNKIHFMGGEIDSGITKLILYITLPAMMLNSVISQTGEKDVSVVLTFIFIFIGAYIVMPVIALLLATLFRIPKNHKGIFMFMLIFGNVGFMGFPIISAMFGDQAVLYAGISNMFYNIVAYSYGIMIVAKDGLVDGNSSGKKFSFNWKKLLNPGITFAILALVIYFIDIPFPNVFCSVVSYLANLTTPLAMLVVGSIMAGMEIKEVFTDVKAYLFVVVKNLLMPVITFFALRLFVKEDFPLQLSFLILVMPVANMSVLFAKEYGSDSKYAARCMFLSTLFCVVTIPLMIYIFF